MKTKRFKWRKFFNDIHLWLGIGSGIILFLVCLTGTILVFEHEIEEFFAYHIDRPEGAKALPLENIIANAEKETGGTASAIRILEDETHAYQVYVKTPESRRPAMYFADPYTGEIKAMPETAASGLLSFAFRMHRWLALDTSIGRPIVGAATIIFVILCLTGLVLWWPKRFKQIKQGLRVKMRSGWKRLNYDLHNVLGFYALALLTIMGLTGLNWSFDWYRNGVSKILNDEVFKQRKQQPLISTATDRGRTFSLEDYIGIADRIVDYRGDRYLVLPVEPAHAVQVRKNKNGFFAVAAPDKIHIDRFSGEVLKTELFHELPLNEKINALMKPLHTGDAFGAFSKILYFIACLIGTSLSVTGTIIWINKLRKKARKRKKTKLRRREGEGSLEKGRQIRPARETVASGLSER